jgi:O-antigen/teichoic acid export membrane protein
MIVNSVLAYYALSKVIDVKIEKKKLINIIIATSTMGIFIAALNNMNIFSNVIILLCAIGLGAFLYIIILLKIDKGIHDELKEMMVQLGLPWPRHL